jgi:Bacterial protein of unknown function (DUF899)
VTQRPRLVVGMSGSSAPHYGIALLQTLHALGSVETHLGFPTEPGARFNSRRTSTPKWCVASPTSCTTRTIWPRRFRRAHFCSTARSQVLIYHFMFGPSYADGCPVNSSIADAFDSLIPHLKARDVSLPRPISDFTIRRYNMRWVTTVRSSR